MKVRLGQSCCMFAAVLVVGLVTPLLCQTAMGG